MSHPLSPLEPSALNIKSPATAERNHHSIVPQTKHSTHDTYNRTPSSSFIAENDGENPSSRNIDRPIKHRSPKKYHSFSPQAQSPVQRPRLEPLTAESLKNLETYTRQLSPTKSSPRKNSPVKEDISVSLVDHGLGNTEEQTQSTPSKPSPGTNSPEKVQHYIQFTEEALGKNDGSNTAQQTTEDTAEESVIRYYTREDDSVMTNLEVKSEFAGVDDTCFSTFSAVPNADMTLFARIGEQGAAGRSPNKSIRAGHGSDESDRIVQTPRPTTMSTPATARRKIYEEGSPTPSPTPRRGEYNSREEGDTTNFIVDFTEQFNSISTASHRLSPTCRHGRPTPSKSKTISDLSSFTANARTPSPRKKLGSATPGKTRYLANLLDFDIPPAPTPRSVPSITPRELESLKSDYLSQISSMRATISGRDAEIASLKKDVQDAEKRVGEAMELVREEKGAKEGLLAEKTEWQARGKEMETVIVKMREGNQRVRQESEDLDRRLEVSERRREEAERKKIEVEGRLVGMTSGESGTTGASVSLGSDGEVQVAIEKVARELHALYKEKHERKLAALKSSYTTRWGKVVQELEERLADCTGEREQVEKLYEKVRNDHQFLLSRKGQESSVSESRPRSSSEGTNGCDTLRGNSTNNGNEESDTAEGMRGLKKLTEEVEHLKAFNEDLERDLRRERCEKGDLVAAVEELLSIQAAAAAAAAAIPRSPPTTTTMTTMTTSDESVRGDIESRCSSGSSIISNGTLVGSGSMQGTQQHHGGSGGGGGSSLSRLESLRGNFSKKAAGQGGGGGGGGGLRPPMATVGGFAARSFEKGANGRSGIMHSIESMGRARGGGGGGGVD